MRIRNLLATALAFFALLPLALAQQSGQKLTLEEAIASATGSSELLRIADYKLKGAEARYKEVHFSRFGTLKYAGSYTRLSNVPAFAVQIPGPDGKLQTRVLNPVILNQFVNKLAFQQPLFMGNRLKNGLLMAGVNKKASETEYKRDKADLILNIKTAYWNLYRAQQVKQQVDEALKQVQAHLTDVENMYKQGLATSNDVLKLKVQLSTTRLQQIEINNAIRLANTNLNSLLGKELGVQNELASTPQGKNELNALSVDQLVERALQNRPEIQLSEMRIQSGELNLKVTKAGYLPQVVAYADYYYSNPNQRFMPQRQRFDGSWDAGISVSFDLWNWNTTKYQSEQARYNLQQSQESLSMIKEQITLEVTQHYLNVLLATEKIAVAEQTIAQAEENLRITEQKLKKGMVLASDLVDAQSALLSARINLVTASVDSETALARLEKAVGGLE